MTVDSQRLHTAWSGFTVLVAGSETHLVPNFSANLTFLFAEAPLPDRFAAASAAGFETVELMFPYELPIPRLCELLDRHNLYLDLFNLPAGDFPAGERGVAALPHRVEEFRNGVATAITYAEATGTRKLNCLVGLRDATVKWDLQYDTLIENLRWAIEQLNPRGLTLHVEPLCVAEVPGFFLDSLPLAKRMLADVEHLRLQFDAYHVQRAHGDLVTNLRGVFDRLGHVQVADSPDRGQPGTGEVNYRFFFEELDRLGYEGRIGLEYRPKGGSTVASLAWLADYGWKNKGGSTFG